MVTTYATRLYFSILFKFGCVVYAYLSLCFLKVTSLFALGLLFFKIDERVDSSF